MYIKKLLKSGFKYLYGEDAREERMGGGKRIWVMRKRSCLSCVLIFFEAF